MDINKNLALLTAEIAKLQQDKIDLSEKLKGKKCNGCFGNENTYKIKDSEGNIYLCITCIGLIKLHNKCSLKKNKKNDCPLCHSDDGKYLIVGLTTNLCKDCFKSVKNLNM